VMCVANIPASQVSHCHCRSRTTNSGSNQRLLRSRLEEHASGTDQPMEEGYLEAVSEPLETSQGRHSLLGEGRDPGE
jgi:hypothetical protein